MKKPNYYAAGVRQVKPITQAAYEQIKDNNFRDCVMWSVYEYEPQENGLKVAKCIADFYGVNCAANAKAFAELMNSPKTF